MIKGIIGGILGLAIALILDFIGVDTYMINSVQPYLNFEFSICHFYGTCAFYGAVAGILPW